jgi:Cd2+/Zn2+-exporting ATPase
MKHNHDCCSSEKKPKQDHQHDDLHNDHDHDHGGGEGWRGHWDLLLGLLILLVMLTFEFGFDIIPAEPLNLVIYLAAYLLAGWNVLYMAWVN